jgi:hypothetical protein
VSVAAESSAESPAAPAASLSAVASSSSFESQLNALTANP